MSTNHSLRRALGAAATLTVLFLGAAPASADPYPPVLPGDTGTTDTAVLGTKTGAAGQGNVGTAVLGTKTGSSQLALTGTDALPYLGGGLILLAGGAGLFVVARRRDPAEPAR